jgi:hypothetical protein
MMASNLSLLRARADDCTIAGAMFSFPSRFIAAICRSLEAMWSAAGEN